MAAPPGSAFVPLLAGWSFAPLRSRELGVPVARPVSGFDELSEASYVWALDACGRGPLAFVEAEYFGGTGAQSAAVFEAGSMVLGPLRSETTWDGSVFAAPPAHERAINVALRRLGVAASAGLDEFDTVGLGRHRSNDGFRTSQR